MRDVVSYSKNLCTRVGPFSTSQVPLSALCVEMHCVMARTTGTKETRTTGKFFPSGLLNGTDVKKKIFRQSCRHCKKKWPFTII